MGLFSNGYFLTLRTRPRPNLPRLSAWRQRWLAQASDHSTSVSRTDPDERQQRNARSIPDGFRALQLRCRVGTLRAANAKTARSWAPGIVARRVLHNGCCRASRRLDSCCLALRLIRLPQQAPGCHTLRKEWSTRRSATRLAHRVNMPWPHPTMRVLPERSQSINPQQPGAKARATATDCRQEQASPPHSVRPLCPHPGRRGVRDDLYPLVSPPWPEHVHLALSR